VQLALDAINKNPAVMKHSFDMWQLGMLIYQLASQPWPYTATYWDGGGEGSTTHLTDSSILKRLIDFHHDTPERPCNPARDLLPHEAKPLKNKLLCLIVHNLLSPTAEARWSCADLLVYLDVNATSLTVQM
jgi:hypothetical protein